MRTQRIDLIEQYITEHKNVTLTTLCKEFQVSKNTIRRDINQLAERGSIKKVYGGVTLTDTSMKLTTLTPFSARSVLLEKEKDAICRYAASMIQDDDIIYIDTGTTSQNLIDYIANKSCIIITNSLQLSFKAVAYPRLTVISLPGKLKRDTLSFTGSEAEQYLSAYNISKAFLCCTGVSVENGLTNATTEEYLIKRAVATNCRTRILMVDHTKFGKFTLMTYCRLSDVDHILTDQLPDPMFTKYCQDHEIIIHKV